MKAVRLVGLRQPLELQEIPTPEVRRGDVLVRIKAAGICHSDAHYRAGTSPVGAFPKTLGHEIAGIVEEVGADVRRVRKGDRVCLHYLVTCGQCEWCNRGQEQFCVEYAMLGKHLDGGYSQYIAVPERGVLQLPDEVPFEQGAIMMCSSATSFHALRKSRIQAGETVAVYGAGGLGMSAIQLARALGAREVYAVDINPDKLRMAEGFGAIPVNAAQVEPVAELMRLTGNRGTDVALELIGLPQTMQQAVRSVGAQGRAVLAGIGRVPFPVDAYSEVVGKETEIIGCSDHLLQEFPLLLDLARRGKLDLSQVVARTVPLAAEPVNEVLDALEQFSADARTVIVP